MRDGIARMVIHPYRVSKRPEKGDPKTVPRDKEVPMGTLEANVS